MVATCLLLGGMFFVSSAKEETEQEEQSAAQEEEMEKTSEETNKDTQAEEVAEKEDDGQDVEATSSETDEQDMTEENTQNEAEEKSIDTVGELPKVDESESIENFQEEAEGDVSAGTAQISNGETEDEIAKMNDKNDDDSPDAEGVIISEVMLGQDGSTKDEFVELYNPTEKDIDLEGWSLKKRTKSGNESNLVSASKFQGTIKAHSYFVITHPNYLAIEKYDITYSGASYSISKDNSAILYNVDSEIVDALCWGSCDYECPGERFEENPGNGESIAWKGEGGDGYMISNDPTPGKENGTGGSGQPQEICGNSILEQEEECDDGNNVEGDGCSADCQIEQDGDDGLLKNILINEVLPDPEGSDAEGEWIELFNNSQQELSLKDCYLIDENLKDKGDPQKYFYFEDIVIEPLGFLVLDYKDTKISLNNTGDIIELYDRKGELLSGVYFGKSPYSDFSWARKEGMEYDWSPVPTPGKENFFPPKVEYSKLLEFNEVLPNPDGTDKDNEWVEIKNFGENKVGLEGWMIENGSGKRFLVGNISADPGELVLIKIKNSPLAIRNRDEELRLLDPNGDVVNLVQVKGYAKSGISYNRSAGGDWSWSKYLTPGKKNKLNKKPVAKVKKDKRVYEDVYANFDASKSFDKDGEKLKFKWDFGDGHKSYLKKTRHRYDKKGEYKASLAVNDGVEETVLKFKVKVRDFPEYDIQIVGLVPNPIGNDRGNEIIVLLNNENKRINLKDYYILTGRNKKQSTRHIIYDDFFLGPGKTREISNDELCKYSLLNKKGAVILAAPDGERLDSVKYFREKIGNGDYYFLNQQGQWEWLVSEPEEDEITEVLGVEIPSRSPVFDWTSITRNESRRCCETKKAQQISNWLYGEREWLTLFSRFLNIEYFLVNI